MTAIDLLRRIFLCKVGDSVQSVHGRDVEKPHPSCLSAEYSNDCVDIDSVGKTKLLSYLSDWAMFQRGIDASRLKDQTISRGMQAVIFYSEYQVQFKAKPSVTYSLYAYDGIKLQEFLDYSENRKILEGAGWPTDAHQFVENVYKIKIEPKENPQLYDLIAFAFNDSRYCDYNPPDDGPRRFVYPAENSLGINLHSNRDQSAKPRLCV
ncbi:MAG: hypothetical protein NDJ24_07500 [Alphaproteobacteria bacterium]|nr:hypothetical protein [Alphaproteobacteria bacterium]